MGLYWSIFSGYTMSSMDGNFFRYYEDETPIDVWYIHTDYYCVVNRPAVTW